MIILFFSQIQLKTQLKTQFYYELQPLLFLILCLSSCRNQLPKMVDALALPTQSVRIWRVEIHHRLVEIHHHRTVPQRKRKRGTAQRKTEKTTNNKFLLPPPKSSANRLASTMIAQSPRSLCQPHPFTSLNSMTLSVLWKQWNRRNSMLSSLASPVTSSLLTNTRKSLAHFPSGALIT